MTGSHLARSFEKVNYLLRPSKQVERKLFIEALHRLGKASVNISDYIYVGLGSVYYADFVLFHKYLFIDNMVCAEAADIPKRMRFNKPYHFITLHMTPVSSVIPLLDRSEKHLVWLDYDCPLSQQVAQDIDGFLTVLAPGSILIVTVEAERRLPEGEDEEDDLSPKEQEERLWKYMTDNFANHLPDGAGVQDLAYNDYPALLARILKSLILQSLLPREGVNFFQLFNFRYSDGTQMLTIGGMIGEEPERRALRDSGIFDLEFVQSSWKPKRISVPPLTAREKQWLDQNLARAGGRTGLIRGAEFELERSKLRNYLKYYRHYPTFHEALL